MKQLLARLWNTWNEEQDPLFERKLLLLALGAVFAWGLLAHAYGFLNGNFSHDGLNAIFANGVEVYWKMQLGRLGTVAYRRVLRGRLNLPWLLGMLSLLWTGLAAYLTVKLLRLRRPAAVVLVSGVLIVNLSTIAMGGTYLYEMDMNLFAVLLAALAVFLWDRYGWPGSLVGALLVTGVLSFYQSLLSVVIGLVMLRCIRRLLDGERFSAVFFPGLRSLLMLALGGGLYAMILRHMVETRGIPVDTGSYNSVFRAMERAEGSPGLLDTLGDVYRSFSAAFFDRAAAHLSSPALCLHVLLAVLAAALLLLFLARGKTGWAEKLLLLALAALLPLGLNVARLFSGRDGHDLMKYAFWLSYLLPLLLADAGMLPLPKVRRVAWIAAALMVGLLLWSGVYTANAVYVKKDLEQKATLSLMTRVLGRIEDREGYVPGETELVFVGANGTLNPALYGFSTYADITGAEAVSAIPGSFSAYYYNAYRAYFTYVLNTRVRLADDAVWDTMQSDERVLAMPAYPARDCIRELDGVWVVKLGEPRTETEAAA